MHILVVEDEAALASFLVPLLWRAGYTAESVGTGAAALVVVAERRPDLVLLDVVLPDLDGLQVCRELRRRPDYLPVILLTGRDSRDDELAGFAAHADDYVTKPFDPQSLLVRVEATLRLARLVRRRQVRLGDVEVDFDRRDVVRDGRAVGLTAREFDLLAYLVEHPGQVFGKTQLLAQVWGPDFEGGAHNVEVRMSRLRSVVERGPGRPRHLHTRPGVGYYVTLEPAR